MEDKAALKKEGKKASKKTKRSRKSKKDKKEIDSEKEADEKDVEREKDQNEKMNVSDQEKEEEPKNESKKSKKLDEEITFPDVYRDSHKEAIKDTREFLKRLFKEVIDPQINNSKDEKKTHKFFSKYDKYFEDLKFTFKDIFKYTKEEQIIIYEEDKLDLDFKNEVKGMEARAKAMIASIANKKAMIESRLIEKMENTVKQAIVKPDKGNYASWTLLKQSEDKKTSELSKDYIEMSKVCNEVFTQSNQSFYDNYEEMQSKIITKFKETNNEFKRLENISKIVEQHEDKLHSILVCKPVNYNIF